MNFERELSGLVQAIKYFKPKSDTFATINQKETFQKEGVTVRLVPAHEYLT
jgi:uncharacterized protein